jgi:hypothetical protein
VGQGTFGSALWKGRAVGSVTLRVTFGKTVFMLYVGWENKHVVLGLYTVHCVLCTVYCVLCTLYCVLCTWHWVLPRAPGPGPRALGPGPRAPMVASKNGTAYSQYGPKSKALGGSLGGARGRGGLRPRRILCVFAVHGGFWSKQKSKNKKYGMSLYTLTQSMVLMNHGGQC